ncbi:MAG TPA: bifunctional GNAT family N-acetyltransferase/carbon-nitrogen hydrolase family protein [Bacteroidia bacterium]|nr:bifunctional GNAT family N-acetyltransferase/carbon-nitrogen hydrolase family protein [Bacteroidia bacterium]
MNLELTFLTAGDYEELKSAMINSYRSMPESYWKEHHINKLLEIFPEGQVVIKVNGSIAGCALSIIVDQKKLVEQHTFREITGNYTFDTHSKYGDLLYGIDVFIKPEFRGMRLGRRLYDYRKELCERLNLRGIVFGGRIPNYHKYADVYTPKEYIDKVKSKELHDPVLSFQLANDFYPVRILRNYLENDAVSLKFAVLLRWDNIYYEKPHNKANVRKSVVRIGLIQWQMRLYRDLKDLMEQAEYFVDALSGYKCDFAVFPEYFNAPLMAAYNDLSESEAIRKLAEFTNPIIDELSKMSVSYNINIIAGSMPEVVNNMLYNVGYLCKRDGTRERYEKIHATPDEERIWGMKGGSQVKTFDTDSGRIGILICYDSEFPELSRLLADEGMEILFVPYLTDTQNGYSRVRSCSQARAIENECYVAITGCVGNLPKVHNMDIQYSQAVVFTPCDFSFPTNGIKSEATANSEMMLIADVDLDLLMDLHNFGSVKNLKDRRKDIYELRRV